MAISPRSLARRIRSCSELADAPVLVEAPASLATRVAVRRAAWLPLMVAVFAAAPLMLVVPKLSLLTAAFVFGWTQLVGL